MRSIFTIVAILVCLILSSCSKESFPSNDISPAMLYDEFWDHVNENYIFFEEKGVDWDEVYQNYAPEITLSTTDEELLQSMENSLLELRDGHNLLRTPLRQSKVYKFKDGYDTSFSPELVESKYIEDDFKSVRSFKYGWISGQETVYIYVPRMEYVYSLRKLIRELVTDQTRNLIIDVRNNGGGNSNPVPELLGDFVTEKTLLGSYIEKSGPDREDETDPIPVYAHPNADYLFDIEVFILINRGGYSATSYLAAMAKGLPNFTIVGQITGGGGGGNAGFELSNGWGMAISVSDFVDKEGVTIENGVSPDVEVENTMGDLENGNDIMLEKVIELVGN